HGEAFRRPFLISECEERAGGMEGFAAGDTVVALGQRRPELLKDANSIEEHARAFTFAAPIRPQTNDGQRLQDDREARSGEGQPNVESIVLRLPVSWIAADCSDEGGIVRPANRKYPVTSDEF